MLEESSISILFEDGG